MRAWLLIVMATIKEGGGGGLGLASRCSFSKLTVCVSLMTLPLITF